MKFSNAAVSSVEQVRSPAATAAIRHADNACMMFSFLWAAAMLVHQIARHRTWFHADWDHLIGWLLTGAAVLVLLRPSSLFLLAIMLVLDVINAFDRMPRLPNHILFNATVSFTILLAMLECRLRGPLDRGRLFLRFAPLVRIQFVLLYTFAALAKLNTDYLNPEVSCGTAMYLEAVTHVQSRYGITLPTVPFFRLASIWGTLILEILLPIMLLLRGWRRTAIVLGIAFHLALSLHPIQEIYSFTAMMIALYFLFAPNDFATRLAEQWRDIAWVRRHRLNEPARIRRLALVGAGTLGAGAAVAMIGRMLLSDEGWRAAFVAQIHLLQDSLIGIGFHLLFFTGLAALIGFIVVTRRMNYEEESIQAKFAVPATIGLVGVTIVFINGMNPYLGFRTETAVAMFSNLRTEAGRTNHLFMPRLHLAGYQDDVAEVLAFELFADGEADDVQLGMIAAEDVYVTWFDLRRRTSSLAHPFRIRYLRNGKEHELDSRVNPDHELCRPHPYLAGKLLDFRIIDKDGPMRCRH